MEDLWLKEYKDKFSRELITTQLETPAEYIQGVTIRGLHEHKQIKATIKSSNRFKVFTDNNPKDYNIPLAY
jgi:hypothetical protein